MFHVVDLLSGNTPVFLEEDPRIDPDFPRDLEVIENVDLEKDLQRSDRLFPDGGARPFPAVGVAIEEPNKYRAFGHESDISGSGYRQVGIGAACVVKNWKEYCKNRKVSG
ncbi:unnamed protein product [Gemmata massiliana]|uniref:Uncharacterized protein n=1 Tax=Gemmata massiliana TaxID=1210884 RepID=A0A6P2DKD4_9BACT|nr:hypothetical protein [Gemmata massiliana]VTS03845.1 unnamed protein product [Gemmata massiliana]